MMGVADGQIQLLTDITQEMGLRRHVQRLVFVAGVAQRMVQLDDTNLVVDVVLKNALDNVVIFDISNNSSMTDVKKHKLYNVRQRSPQKVHIFLQ